MPTYTLVGMQYADSEEIVRTITVDEEVRLVREPENPVDANAVKVLWQDIPIGYIKRAEAAILSSWMAAIGSSNGISGTFLPGSPPTIRIGTDIG